MVARSATVLVLPLLLGCGARDALPDEGNSATFGSTGVLAVLDCDPAGVRLCGGETGCPALGFDECPGVGCTPVADRYTGEPLDVGICWPDLYDWVQQPCTTCDADQACARYADTLGYYCVPLEVCGALLAMGGGNGCRYTDGSAFTGDALSLDSSTCDKGSDTHCGPACRACESVVLDQVCMGLSPTSPVGACVTDGAPETCSRDAPACNAGVCMVFEVPPEDQAFADAHGVCQNEALCEDMQAAGAARCYAP